MSTRLRRGALVPALLGLAGCGLWMSADGGLEIDHWQDLSCAAIAVPPGPEDVAIDHAAGKAYIASTDRRAVAGQRPARGPIGRLSVLDLKQERPQAIDVTPEELRAGIFQPHGIGLWPGVDKRLFAVNRRPALDPETGRWDSCDLSNAVEVLAIEDDGLRHIETLDSPHLIRPNDVAPTSEQTFYVTNDHGTRACWAQNLRDLFGHNRGHVLYYDGSAFRPAAEDVPFANGIAYDGAQGALYVASSLDGTIERFLLRPDDVLDERISIRLGTAPDNLSVGPDGWLLLAAHPDRWRFLLHARRWLGAERAPSQIIEIGAPGGEDPQAIEIWRDDGGLIPAASTAAAWHWQEERTLRLLIGAVFTDHVLLCDRPASAKKTALANQGRKVDSGRQGTSRSGDLGERRGRSGDSTPVTRAQKGHGFHGRDLESRADRGGRGTAGQPLDRPRRHRRRTRQGERQEHGEQQAGLHRSSVRRPGKSMVC